MSVSSQRLILATSHPEVALRQLALRDADELFALIDKNRKHLNQFGNRIADKYRNIASVRRSITDPPDVRRIRFGIWLRRDRLTGSVNIHPQGGEAEIGYWVGHEFCRRGIATVATQTVVWYGRSLTGVDRIVAYVNRDNRHSQMVLLRVGMTEVERSGNDIKFSLRL